MIWLLVEVVEPYCYYSVNGNTPDIRKATTFVTAEEAQAKVQSDAYFNGQYDRSHTIYHAVPYCLETIYHRQEVTTRDPRE